MARKMKQRKLTLLIFFIIIVLFFFYLFKSLPEQSESMRSKHLPRDSQYRQRSFSKEGLTDLLTIIILDFEDFDNALTNTTNGLQDILGPVPIFIIAKYLPYPPIKLEPKGSARIITLNNNLIENYTTGCISQQIQTEFVLFLPDATTVDNFNNIKTFIAFLKSRKETKAVAIPQVEEHLTCEDFKVDLKRWTIAFERNYSKSNENCPLVKGRHGVLMRTNTLRSLPVPFMRPFPFTFYVQAKVKGWRIRIMNSGRIGVLSSLYTEPHSKWKRKKAETGRLREFYTAVGLKQEISASGTSQFYGCNKYTPRCFGTVLNDMPAYLYEGRWTPPCCLKALRETITHVIAVLETCRARYWLEGGSLLGAARINDIIPWDYDVDLGIYKEDVTQCEPLQRAAQESEVYVDEQDYVWEKAKEGEFYRVQFSETNHLHVDIYPFYAKNGIMTKDTWFPTHRQDVEFPEKYLKPLTKIMFAGIEASAPNNIKTFLEYKFGKGVIENPRYPNLQKPL